VEAALRPLLFGWFFIAQNILATKMGGLLGKIGPMDRTFFSRAAPTQLC
jgi:hypothetical protein